MRESSEKQHRFQTIYAFTYRRQIEEELKPQSRHFTLAIRGTVGHT